MQSSIFDLYYYAAITDLGDQRVLRFHPTRLAVRPHNQPDENRTGGLRRPVNPNTSGASTSASARATSDDAYDHAIELARPTKLRRLWSRSPSRSLEPLVWPACR